ncbi:bifunctional 4-hydroxy-2-oxoglutarate aldolase/2-dehydro-3-deoxy-phosphogluconate aldolase [Leptobacterium flavescens]|uniref:Bifunctional 4-hydroxy-2-oxoglutarate aldolase/2-dehydro-3-deoxy-phosphogluconate aldolase n=1 Tax=Leptobacterium flavescens TaxID=472055 RepID=A0A6P0UMC2_9FLAO|nr:bifunctional 4-hydroxy-2-oxoglutarate aldolase/2-dehydro-3-deoxy-phosphogluconate aldolase [Leptobacterium flavescens]NER13722.1 bifunctional 4-hydroxy-2-oxoglutarate aldolase/2-dehydro-3-deoxy-phosphogluconate aldolase [Leptobacterium flavescens]
MEKRARILSEIGKEKIIAILRLTKKEDVFPVAEAMIQGGIRNLEITANTPGYLEAIHQISQYFPEINIGAGTITNETETREAISAGAQFIITPIVNTAIIKEAHLSDVPVIMGAFTPTEIEKAHRNGADAIKIFPASGVGTDYLKAIAGPFPKIKMVPTGGVNKENMREWLECGAYALGVGGSLLDKDLIASRSFYELTQKAKSYLHVLRETE